MALTAGTRIGSYEIVGAIGAGGMGEVYRARDSKLNRDVAIKVLPQLFASDAERVHRFEREAQTLGGLNHPNIAHVHGVLEQPLALVMELVEGDDLSSRIGSSGMPLADALPIARQIAEALEAAHERGVIHRDLKPANIKVRVDGVVKVLDFGLAKAMDPTGSAATLANSPTFMTAATEVGTILGTAAYMSPEQARGKPVDKRADIWAFGCVLFEMLTGRVPFEGETITDLLGAIVQTAPDLTLLPAATPPSVQALIARCLEKDATRRLRDIGEARVLLADERAMAAASVSSASVSARPWSRARIALAAGAMLLVVALAAAAGYFARPSVQRLPVRKSHVAVQAGDNSMRSHVISPDGRSIVFSSRSRLWVQPLDAWEPRELQGTEGGTRPFWSPRSDWIAFFRSEKLLKVPVSGGAVVDVATLPAVQAPLGSSNGVWTDDGTVILSLAAGRSVHSVSSGGGELREFFKVPDGIGIDLHDMSLLPGDAIVAGVHRADGVDAIGILAGGVLTIVLEASNVGHPRYAPSGHLLFERQSPNAGLWAVPFSAERRQTEGEPFFVARGTEPSVARDGTLLYRGEPEALARQIAWFTIDGRVGDVVAPPQDWIEGIALSPDGKRLLASATDGIWAYDIATGTRSRLTSGRTDITPQWVGASGQMVFVRSTGSSLDLIIKKAHVGGEEKVLAENARFPTVTKDARRVVFNQRSGASAQWQIAWIDLDKPKEIHRLDGPHRGARFPVVSPDGRFVAYVSGEMGRDEIFLTDQHGNGKVQVSANGGGWCRFSGRGDAIVYRAPGGDFMSVPFTGSSDLTLGRPQRLFEWGSGWSLFYELAGDGLRGLTAVPVTRTSTVSSLSLVQNWYAEFSR
jgi:eukaryotic-like serine/threonine-protein kinase